MFLSYLRSSKKPTKKKNRAKGNRKLKIALLKVIIIIFPAQILTSYSASSVHSVHRNFFTVAGVLGYNKTGGCGLVLFGNHIWQYFAQNENWGCYNYEFVKLGTFATSTMFTELCLKLKYLSFNEWKYIMYNILCKFVMKNYRQSRKNLLLIVHWLYKYSHKATSYTVSRPNLINPAT